jgi:hypothetical protein
MNHVCLDENEGHTFTKRAKGTNDTKSKKGLKNTREKNDKKEILGVCQQ